MPHFERMLSMPGTDYLALGDAGDGPYVAAIRAAAAVFGARVLGADLAEYMITVCRVGGRLSVIFLDKERPEGMRGDGGRPGCPGFEVKLAEDLAVVKSHFVR